MHQIQGRMFQNNYTNNEKWVEKQWNCQSLGKSKPGIQVSFMLVISFVFLSWIIYEFKKYWPHGDLQENFYMSIGHHKM